MGPDARWAEKKVGCYPLNSSSCLFRNAQGVPELLNKQVLDLLFENKIIPVMTGDLIFRKETGDRKYEIFSSDYLPSILSDYFEISKAIMLTDVDGIFEPETGKVFREVNQNNFRDVIACASGSKMQDFTGGMVTKLKAMLELSNKGVETFVCNGTKMLDVEASILTQKCPGTKIIRNIEIRP